MRSALIAACYSAACRPPTSGGTGGSIAGPRPGTRAAMGGTKVKVAGRTVGISSKPKVIDAKDSPHYKKRGDMRAISEEEGAKLVMGNGNTRRVVGKGLPAVKDGQEVGVRPQLNILKQTGKLVQTLHDGRRSGKSKKAEDEQTAATGDALGYRVSATVRDARLTVDQRARADIATGKVNKFPMSSVDGKFVSKPGSDEFDGVELRFNPKREHVYLDPDGRPVKSVGEATIVGTPEGPRVFARGRIEYFDESDYPKPLDDVPTAAKL